MLAELNWTDRDLAKPVRLPSSPKRVGRASPSDVHGQQITNASSVASRLQSISASSTPSSSQFSNFIINEPATIGRYLTSSNSFIRSWSEVPGAATSPLIFFDECATLYVIDFGRNELEARTATNSIGSLSSELFQMLQQEPISDGFSHPGEAVLRRMFDEHPAEASAWVGSCIAGGQGSSRAADILKLLCRFKPQNTHWRLSIVTTALGSSSDEVRDVAIQAIESWGEPALVDLLRSHLEKVAWLADYKRQVLIDLGS